MEMQAAFQSSLFAVCDLPSFSYPDHDSNYPADLSQKNPISILPSTATLVDLLAFFADGVHRGAFDHRHCLDDLQIPNLNFHQSLDPRP